MESLINLEVPFFLLNNGFFINGYCLLKFHFTNIYKDKYKVNVKSELRI